VTARLVAPDIGLPQTATPLFFLALVATCIESA